MPAEQILSNARLVLADQVIHGSLLIRDGLIADISAGASSLPQAQDLDGALLLPGLVELHTDNLPWSFLDYFWWQKLFGE